MCYYAKRRMLQRTEKRVEPTRCSACVRVINVCLSATSPSTCFIPLLRPTDGFLSGVRRAERPQCKYRPRTAHQTFKNALIIHSPATALRLPSIHTDNSAEKSPRDRSNRIKVVKVKLIAATLTNRVFVKCFEMIKTDKTWKGTAKLVK